MQEIYQNVLIVFRDLKLLGKNSYIIRMKLGPYLNNQGRGNPASSFKKGLSRGYMFKYLRKRKEAGKEAKLFQNDAERRAFWKAQSDMMKKSKSSDVTHEFINQKSLIFEYQSRDHVAIRTKRFRITDDLIKLIKEHEGTNSEDDKCWIVPLEQYNDVISACTPLCKELNIKIDAIPQTIIKTISSAVPFGKTKRNIVGFDYSSDKMVIIYFNSQPNPIEELPKELQTKLYKFQMQGIEFGISHFGRVLLGDEIGVGKSVQALAISYLYRSDWPLLILSPSSFKLVWVEEILKWFPDITSDKIQVVQTSHFSFESTAQIFIMSYDLARNIQDKLSKMKFKVAIADEAHLLKNREVKRTKTLSPILKQCKRIILLTGTAMLIKPMDIFNLIHILRPDLFPNFKDFGFRYCDPRPGYFGTDWSGSANIEELNLILSSTVMISRHKEQLLQELPRKRRQKIEIETEGKPMREVQQILRKLNDSELKRLFHSFSIPDEGDFPPINDIMGKVDSEDLSHIMNAHKLTGLAKVKGINDFLNTLIENDIKFILFAHHLEVLNLIEEHLKKKKIGLIRFDSDISSSRCHTLVSKFQADPNIRVALLSFASISQGINLTGVSTVVFAEMNWSPEVMKQAEDIAQKPVQENSVNIYYMYAENTLDSIVFRIIKSKNEVVSQVLDKESFNDTVEKNNAKDTEIAVLMEQHKKKIPKKEKRHGLMIIRKSDEQDEMATDLTHSPPKRSKPEPKQFSEIIGTPSRDNPFEKLKSISVQKSRKPKKRLKQFAQKKCNAFQFSIIVICLLLFQQYMQIIKYLFY